MTTLHGHKTWLLVSAVVIGGFGPVFTFGAAEATAGAATWTLDLLAWPLDGAQAYDEGTTRFLSALTGGFLLGWGVMVLCLRAWVFDAAPEGVRRSLVVGAAAWFVLDSAGSIASGTPSNALFNVAVLLLVVGPMWLPADTQVSLRAHRTAQQARHWTTSGVAGADAVRYACELGRWS